MFKVFSLRNMRTKLVLFPLTFDSGRSDREMVKARESERDGVKFLEKPLRVWRNLTERAGESVCVCASVRASESERERDREKARECRNSIFLETNEVD